jgi:hypothetical protein
MRKTKYTFFIILVFLTAVLFFIIIGEDTKYQTNNMSYEDLVVKNEVYDKANLVNRYQIAVVDIFNEYQQQILQQSIKRDDAVLQIRERILAIAKIPVELQAIHLKMVVALSRDLNGFTDEAILSYQELQFDYEWLFDQFNFLID